MTVQLIVPRRHEDARGWFCETWNRRVIEGLGLDVDFVQDNHSLSRQAGTIRGLHFQRAPFAQSKLVRCIRGRIFDVVVDIRRASPTFKQWAGIELSAKLGNQLFVPAGFAHGFLTLEPDCEVAYKVDAYYAPEADGGLAWNDPDLAIDWPLAGLAPTLSDKDAGLPNIDSAEFDFAYDGTPLPSLDA